MEKAPVRQAQEWRFHHQTTGSVLTVNGLIREKGETHKKNK